MNDDLGKYFSSAFQWKPVLKKYFSPKLQTIFKLMLFKLIRVLQNNSNTGIRTD